MKFKIQNQKFPLLALISTFLILLFAFNCSAKEITILYTGDTHAMLYPCHCPIEPDGGLARRMSLIKELRESNPHSLLLDSGAFFAGGLMDVNTQNVQLDKQRASVNVSGMRLMRYDAACVGDNEFNFGKEFLEQEAATAGFAFLSANLSLGQIKPILIKDIGGVKIGITALTNPQAASKTAGAGLTFIAPDIALRQAIVELKKSGAELIVVLSRLGESEDKRLIGEISGIDILITAYSQTEKNPPQKIGNTLILRPSWEGRRLGKLTFQWKNNRITDYKIEDLRLSDKVQNDKEITAILPQCFWDSDCVKVGLIGACQEPGTLKSSCQFTQAARINLTVILPEKCIACSQENVVLKQLKSYFPGLSVSYLYYPQEKAKRIIQEFGVTSLPAYLFTKEIEKENSFSSLKDKLSLKADAYLLKPQFSGVFYFPQRKKIKGNLDLFISLFDNGSATILEAIKNFHPQLHFLVRQENDDFQAHKGREEIEEDLRAVCVQKYYPQAFWNYLTCRVGKIDSSWWEDCLGNLESGKIKACARSAEGKDLLRQNIQLNRELDVMFGPVYLVDNQETFGTNGSPSERDFKKILKR